MYIKFSSNFKEKNTIFNELRIKNFKLSIKINKAYNRNIVPLN